MTNNPAYLVIEGPIGVGKTSLAKRLAKSFGSELLLEAAEANPFLPKFYRRPEQMALATQLFFLLQRAQQLNEIRQGDLFAPVRIADFLIDKDQLFAQLTLNHDELMLYQQIYAHLTLDAPTPDLVVYLQAPVDILLQRITARGIPHEQSIDSMYLQRIVEAYAQFFYDYTASPLLIVNAAAVDFVNNDADYQQLLTYIQQTRNGRHYFNPSPLKV